MTHQAPASDLTTSETLAADLGTGSAAAASATATAAGAEASGFVDFFKHQGKVYKIFKRVEGKDAPWYCHYQFEGKRHLVNARTNQRVNAIAFFRAHLEASWSGRLAALQVAKERAATRWSTIGEFCRAVEQAPLNIAAETRRQYVNCLCNVVRRAKGRDVDVQGMGLDLFDADLVRGFFENAVKGSQKITDQEGSKRALRTANSILNQARALFRPKVLSCLRRNGYVNGDAKRIGLELPDFGWLESAWQEERFEGVSKVEWAAPSDALMRRTLRAWTKLTDRNHFLAVGLELCFGLRKGEVSQVRWDWLTWIEGQPFLDGRGKVKNGSARLCVRALDPFWTVWRRRVAREGWEPKGSEVGSQRSGDYILSGTETERCESVFRTVGAWLRELGWQTQKTNHAFRAYAGSQVAMRYGIYSASTWCRHSSVTVTEQHYSHFIEQHRDEQRSIRRRWARGTKGAEVREQRSAA